MSVPDFSNHIIHQYKLVQPLQERPFTTLYLGQDTKLDQPLFVEVMNQAAAENEELAGRFQRRLETVRQLDHPHIAPILQVGRANLTSSKSGQKSAKAERQHLYAIIDYITGPTLAQQIETWRETGDWPDVPARLSLVRDLASALTMAHPVGLFHHDLRPANLIMGENGRLTFIDLGVPTAPAHPPDPQQLPAQLDYTSPEQLEGKVPTGPSNIYSLGIILYELLAGHRPHLPGSAWDIFERTDLPREIPLPIACPGLTDATYVVVKTCLWRQYWNRYETAVHLLNALDAAHTAEEKAHSDATTLRQRQLPPRYWRYAGGGLLLLLLLILTIWLLLPR